MVINEKFNNNYDVFHSYLVEDADYEGDGDGDDRDGNSVHRTG